MGLYLQTKHSVMATLRTSLLSWPRPPVAPLLEEASSVSLSPSLVQRLAAPNSLLRMSRKSTS